jgi:hypothetical protein
MEILFLFKKQLNNVTIKQFTDLTLSLAKFRKHSVYCNRNDI